MFRKLNEKVNSNCGGIITKKLGNFSYLDWLRNDNYKNWLAKPVASTVEHVACDDENYVITDENNDFELLNKGNKSHSEEEKLINYPVFRV